MRHLSRDQGTWSSAHSIALAGDLWRACLISVEGPQFLLTEGGGGENTWLVVQENWEGT